MVFPSGLVLIINLNVHRKDCVTFPKNDEYLDDKTPKNSLNANVVGTNTELHIKGKG